MNGYLLDTNIISDRIRNLSGIVARHLEQVEGLLETIPVLPLDIPVDAKYGSIRAELELAGQTIGMNDLLIAAHAHALGLTLVIDKTREFSHISGLSLEN